MTDQLSSLTAIFSALMSSSREGRKIRWETLRPSFETLFSPETATNGIDLYNNPRLIKGFKNVIKALREKDHYEAARWTCENSRENSGLKQESLEQAFSAIDFLPVGKGFIAARWVWSESIEGSALEQKAFHKMQAYKAYPYSGSSKKCTASSRAAPLP